MGRGGEFENCIVPGSTDFIQSFLKIPFQTSGVGLLKCEYLLKIKGTSTVGEKSKCFSVLSSNKLFKSVCT